ncbi:DUF4238 domain-containing protein [Methylobacter sp.]|uniref:DUF4238 domain-containing protein n=1 Tax=Methylobacter sp. TaxID=2051955 RepID=UPI002488ED9F|nr:DUF4238 domain-containing protein [Methylobacter sp.]MDI1279662.1 DUF4238 domain-containing protein [Methylobacter sp.]
MVLLKNNTISEFLTGDQPVINTYAIGLAEEETPEELEFYYPVSPNLAILITKNIEVRNSNILLLNKSQVDDYNKMIVQQSHSQLFASSKEALLAYF